MAKIHLISLGCFKNLVDSEYLLGILKKDHHEFVVDPKDADVVILNTCSFISSARKEAKRYINKLIKFKKNFNFKLVVIGCLPQLEKNSLIKQYPDIDAIFGVSDYINLSKKLNQLINKKSKIIEVSTHLNFIPNCNIPRIISTPKSYAYLKIADGCDNRCTYCLIPKIRGDYRERPMEDIVEEAKQIVSNGTKELIVVSHDTTLYGVKLYKKQMLDVLLDKLTQINEVFWIRILYSHPAHFYDKLIEKISSTEKICKYIDIPIQHTSDKVLSLMGRKTTRKDIYNLVEKLRKKIKDITIRTTVMVGFPNETDKDFQILLEDLKRLEFDWLGCFIFSKQKETLAEKLNDFVDKKTKKERMDLIMKLQQKITFEKNKSRVDKIYKVLVDETKFGHAEFQCPEVDGKIYFLNQPKNLLEKVKIRNIKDIYDLEGEIL